MATSDGHPILSHAFLCPTHTRCRFHLSRETDLSLDPAVGIVVPLSFAFFFLSLSFLFSALPFPLLPFLYTYFVLVYLSLCCSHFSETLSAVVLLVGTSPFPPDTLTIYQQCLECFKKRLFPDNGTCSRWTSGRDPSQQSVWVAFLNISTTRGSWPSKSECLERWCGVFSLV